MSGISTHILDTSKGKPVPGISVRLLQENKELSSEITDQDGRIRNLSPANTALARGTYRLTFELGDYFPESFYPEVTITIRITKPAENHHVPLLISPFGYTTYRGS